MEWMMVAVDTVDQPTERDELRLQPGPCWDSFEQFRLQGVQQLQQQLGEDQVGRLTVKGQQYVIVRGTTFSRLYGLALDARRLGWGLRLIRQAVRLLVDTHGSTPAIEHMHDLVCALPIIQDASVAPEPVLVFDEHERADEPEVGEGPAEFELDARKVKRPAFSLNK
jgi:hypothetical protein